MSSLYSVMALLKQTDAYIHWQRQRALNIPNKHDPRVHANKYGNFDLRNETVPPCCAAFDYEHIDSICVRLKIRHVFLLHGFTHHDGTLCEQTVNAYSAQLHGVLVSQEDAPLLEACRQLIDPDQPS